jgi:hypothetical protein
MTFYSPGLVQIRQTCVGTRRPQMFHRWDKKTINMPSLGQDDHKCAIVGTRRPQMCHRWDKKTTNVPSLGQEDHKCAILQWFNEHNSGTIKGIIIKVELDLWILVKDIVCNTFCIYLRILVSNTISISDGPIV